MFDWHQYIKLSVDQLSYKMFPSILLSGLVRVLPPHGMTTQPLPAIGHVQEALRDDCRQEREKTDGPHQGGTMTDDHLLGGMMGEGRHQGGVTRDDHHQGEAMRGVHLQRRHPLSERSRAAQRSWPRNSLEHQVQELQEHV